MVVRFYVRDSICVRKMSKLINPLIPTSPNLSDPDSTSLRNWLSSGYSEIFVQGVTESWFDLGNVDDLDRSQVKKNPW